MSGKREGELLIPFLTLVTDIIMLEVALGLSYWLRFYSPLIEWIPVTKGLPPYLTYFSDSFFLVIVWIFFALRRGLFAARRATSPVDEFYSIVKIVSITMMVTMSAAFFYRGFSYSRIVFIYVWLGSTFFLTVSRLLVIYLERWRYRTGSGLLNVAIVGSGKGASQNVENILKYPGIGFRLTGFFGEMSALSQKTKRLGAIQNLPEVIRQEKIHTLILALGEKQHEMLLPIFKLCEGLNVEFLLLPDLVELMTSQLQIVQRGDISMIQIKDVRIKGWRGISKRIFDITISTLGLLLLAPVFALVSLVIKLESRGTVFFKQERIGFDGKEFLIYKFRSMKEDAEVESGPVWASEKDPRRTMIGMFLRRSSIDELPQLINVLKGEMSLVGPRPERKVFVEKFRREIPRYLERHRVRSGMTGWAQVNGLRGNTPIDERTRYDIYYVENWSFAFDLKIILKTISAVIIGENSY